MSMNRPPETYIRVSATDMQRFGCQCLRAAGLVQEKADFLAQLLIDCDLRGVFSHGTQQVPKYAHLIRNGKINGNPKPHVVKETPVSMLMDGDGGLGYFPVYEGTKAIIEKANEHGVAVLVTKNHGHIGAAGIYARLPLKHDLLTFVTSGSQLRLSAGKPVFAAAGSPPMAFSAPGGTEDSLVLDFGVMQDLTSFDTYRDELVAKVPGVVFRLLGLGSICQSWGGLLAGNMVDASKVSRQYQAANQGALVMTFKVSLFLSPEQFKQQMDEYVREVRLLQPLKGFDQAYLPGGVEAARERAYRQEGIPVGPEHQQQLEKIAAELDVPVPWRA